MKKILILLFPTTLLANDGLPGSLLPSSEVLNLGEVRLEASFASNELGNYPEVYDYAIGVGATDDLSISFRLSDRRQEGSRYLDNGRMRGNRDLSSYVRFRAYEGQKLDVTMGADDVLGLAKNFSKGYGVLTYQVSDSFFLSAGISKPLCDGCGDVPTSVFGQLNYALAGFKLGLGYDDANESWTGAIQKSFGKFALATAKTNSVDQVSVSWTGKPFDLKRTKDQDTSQSSQTKLTLQPIYSTAIGTEYGVVDFSLGVRTKLSIPVNQKLTAHLMQDVPVYNTLKYRDGEYYQDRQLEVRTQFLGLSAAPSNSLRVSFGATEISGELSPTVQLNYTAQLTENIKISTRHAIITSAGDTKLLSQNRLNYHLPWDRWESYFEYGRYYYGDAGTRFGLQNTTGSLTYGGELSYINDIDYSASLFLSLALPSREYKVGSLHVGLEDSISYQMTTTLADPLQVIYPSLKDANRQQPYRMRTDGYVFGLFD